jgi:hypothetical protein
MRIRSARVWGRLSLVSLPRFSKHLTLRRSDGPGILRNPGEEQSNRVCVQRHGTREMHQRFVFAPRLRAVLVCAAAHGESGPHLNAGEAAPETRSVSRGLAYAG